jgi:hypothetical protein
MRVGWLVLAGCGRFGFGGVADAPPDPTLRVTVPDDRMAGPSTMASVDELAPGTVGLSLREALVIAANHDGPDTVAFDSTVFPTSAQRTIAVGSELVVGGDATTLDATDGVAIAPAPGYTGTLVHVTGTNATVSALTVQGPADEGIRIESTSQVSLLGAHVAIAGVFPIHVLASTDVVVDHATVVLATKVGVVYGVRLESSSRVHVTNSYIDPGTAWMISLQDTADSEIRGNLLEGADTGITLFGASDRNTIFMNIGVSATNHCVYIDNAPANNIVMNNTSFLAAGGGFSIGNATTMVLNNLDSTNAADFADPTTNDFHLIAGSPSIDAATDVGQDMLPDDPTRRFLGKGPDLGAVESY